MKADWRAHLEAEWEVGQHYQPNKADWLDGAWSGLRTADNQDEQRRGKTAVPVKTLKEIGKKLTEVPAGFEAHKTIVRFLDNRRKMIDSGEGIDWSTAEALAFGSILLDGNPIRLSGQDSERGTFSQRHSVLYDQRDETPLHPAQQSVAGAGQFRGHQLDALGRGGARLRIRLFAGRAECADPVGGAVRRLRQRRASGVRPVHLVGRAQVAAHVRPRLPVAAWL